MSIIVSFIMKNYLLNLGIFILVVFSNLPFANALANWNHFIINYDKVLYGKGAQTWQIVSSKRNWTFFANRNGLVQFDGSEWKLFPLKNHSDLRSVTISSNHQRIYVGGINEYGYFEPSNNGEMRYTCLSDTLSMECGRIGNVWGIYETDNILYVQGDDRVVKSCNGEYTALRIEAKIDCSNLVNGVLYIGTDRGVWVLVGNTFFPLHGGESLNGKRIRAIIPYKKGILVVTAYHGLFYCDGKGVHPFITGAEDFMKKNEVFCAAQNGHRIALGTIHKGILMIDCNTLGKSFFNENNGLKNNTVLSVAFDGDGNLWAGLDNGIDYVLLDSPFTNLYAYPNFYGTGYTAILEGDKLFLGTNRGLYYMPYPMPLNGHLPNIQSVEHSSGQVWNLCRVGNELFCLHDRGLFLIQGIQMTKITDIIGAWCCQPVMGHPDMMFVGVYNGLYLLRKNQGVWEKVGRVEGVTDSFRFFAQESTGVLWTNSLGHLSRLELSKDLTRVVARKNYSAKGLLPSSDEILITKIEGAVCFATSKGVYTYNKATDAVIPLSDLNRLLNGEVTYTQLMEYHNKVIGLTNQEICIANLGTHRRGEKTLHYPIRQSLIELVPKFESLIPLTDSLFVVPNGNGFALLNLAEGNQATLRSQSVNIRNMYLSHPKDSLVYTASFLGKKPVLQISHEYNSVRFEYGVNSMALGNDVLFQYRLNDAEWSDFTSVRTKEFSHLFEGNYLFEVKVVYPDGRVAKDEIAFVILPPWYRTITAYVIYGLLLCFVFWMLYRWDDIRLKQKKQQAVLEKEKELRKLEETYEAEKEYREKQIMQLEKEKLEHDLQYKSQEMTNLMINFLRKNEMLTEIKSEIFKVISLIKGDGGKEVKQQLLVINNKIDANIQSDEVLKRIEEEFDLLHNDFMKRLSAKHPSLSTNERMMCAYLIMNLSTKEMAPLLNISIRGVETIRYRLRKKFNLEREEGLTEYLNEKL